MDKVSPNSLILTKWGLSPLSLSWSVYLRLQYNHMNLPENMIARKENNNTKVCITERINFGDRTLPKQNNIKRQTPTTDPSSTVIPVKSFIKLSL